ncbi:MAG: LLM class flavin-dependent oxidoreductase [Chloroflexota bacterium]|nr:LLM class flavin-dependent oxidoreductase [Chloroflexota bacterium]
MPAIQFGYHTVPRGEGDPATEPHPSHRLMLRDAQQAERLGFDSVWVPDHFYFERFGRLETYPDLWTLLTAIGVTTERVRIGTNVIAATFRHPALLAKMAGALQELCDGRLILGMGAGNQPHEHNAFGLDFERRIGRFKEYIPILTALLNGETVSFEGRYFTLREASLRTAVPKVPLWIAAGGEQMFALTAKYAGGWNAAGGAGGDPAVFKAKYDGLAQACRVAGRDVKDMDVCLLTFLAPEPDAATARRTLEGLAAHTNSTPEEVQKRTAVGTPDEIAARLRPFAELGVNHFICAVSLPPDPERYWERVELLAREVFPRVKA